jgi:hypothetical protein
MTSRAAVLLALVLGLSSSAPGFADDLEAKTFARGWAGAETVWTTGVDRHSAAVGWVAGQIGFGRFALAGTAGALGQVGKFEPNTPATYSSLRLQAAALFNVVARPGFTCGPAAAIEGGVPLDLAAGVKAPALYHAVTWGVGLECQGAGWAGYRLFGQDSQLHGFATLGYTHVPMSDRVAWVIRDSFGGEQRFVLTLDVVVRVF